MCASIYQLFETRLFINNSNIFLIKTYLIGLIVQGRTPTPQPTTYKNFYRYAFFSKKTLNIDEEKCVYKVHFKSALWIIQKINLQIFFDTKTPPTPSLLESNPNCPAHCICSLISPDWVGFG